MAFYGFLKIITNKSTANSNGRINDRKAMGNCDKYITQKDYYIKNDTIGTSKEKTITMEQYKKLPEEERKNYTHKIKTRDDLISATNGFDSKNFTKQACKISKQNGFDIDSKDFKRLATHMVQGFSTYDDISPEQAHKIGVELAEKMFPNCAVLVTTHIDHLDENGKGYLHNHFLICDCTLNKVHQLESAYQNIDNPKSYLDSYQYDSLNKEQQSNYRKVEDVTIRVEPHKLQDGKASYNTYGEHTLRTAKEFCREQYKVNNLEWSLLSEIERKAKLAEAELLKARTEEKNASSKESGNSALQPLYEKYRNIIDSIIDKVATFKDFKKQIKEQGIKVSRDSYERNSVYFEPINKQSDLKPVSGAKLDKDENGNNLGRYTRRALDELIRTNARNRTDRESIDSAIAEFTRRTKQTRREDIGDGRNTLSDSKADRVIEPITREPERDDSRSSKVENRTEGITRDKRTDIENSIAQRHYAYRRLTSKTSQRRENIEKRISGNNKRINGFISERDKQKEHERTRENEGKRGKPDKPSVGEEL